MQLSLADQGLQYKDGQIVNSRSDTWFDPRHDCGNKQKQEWSEEDDYNWSKINEALQDKYTESYSKELFNWLKSLCHQKHWKPSGEIMDGLNEVINMLADSAVIHENSYLFYIMVNLRKQLKAL